MANEATQVEGPYEIHDFTVAVGTGIEQGTVCKLADPRTASASSSNDIFAGIAATEKVASNGKTELGLYTKGIFLMTSASGAITAGMAVSLSGANLIHAAAAGDLLNGKAFGTALETFGQDETGEVMVGVY